LVGGRNDDDRAGHSFRAEVFFDELTEFTPTLTDEGDDIDIRLSATCDHTEEGGFADSRACKNAKALTTAYGSEQVEGFHTCLKWLENTLAGEGIGRLAMEWPKCASRKRSFAIDGTADAVDDAADKGVADIDACGATRGSDFAACVDFLHLAEGHEKNAVVPKANRFGLQTVEAGGANFADVSEGNIGPNGFDNKSSDLHDFAHSHQRGGGFNATAQVLHERGQNG
jgi:hypothetical protein